VDPESRVRCRNGRRDQETVQRKEEEGGGFVHAECAQIVAHGTVRHFRMRQMFYACVRRQMFVRASDSCVRQMFYACSAEPKWVAARVEFDGVWLDAEIITDLPAARRAVGRMCVPLAKACLRLAESGVWNVQEMLGHPCLGVSFEPSPHPHSCKDPCRQKDNLVLSCRTE
jgi:hypothetical protein